MAHMGKTSAACVNVSGKRILDHAHTWRSQSTAGMTSMSLTAHSSENWEHININSEPIVILADMTTKFTKPATENTKIHPVID